MAVPVISPLAAQGVVVVPRLQRPIVGQGLHDGSQDGVEVCPVPTPGLPLVVALELARPLNRPRAGR